MRLGASLIARRFASGGRADAGGERIAGAVRGEIHHAAALHAVGRAHGAFGEYVIVGVAVVSRIGVNEAADGAVLGGDFGLDAAPGIAILGDDDRALSPRRRAGRVLRSPSASRS